MQIIPLTPRDEHFKTNEAGGASPSPTVLGCRYLTDKSKFEERGKMNLIQLHMMIGGWGEKRGREKKRSGG